MKVELFSLVGCLLLVQTLSSAVEPDHLLPVDLTRYSAYRGLLHRKLEKSSFDCGRIIVRPAFDTERSISIRREGEGTASGFIVTCITAQKRLWDISDGGSLVDKAADVPVKRVDQSIPANVAVAIKTAFEKVLSETQAIGASELPKRVVLEGLNTEFSLPRADGSIARGEIRTVPPTGPKLKKLEELTLNLLAYCEASSTTRHSLGRKIAQDAAFLGRKQ